MSEDVGVSDPLFFSGDTGKRRNSLHAPQALRHQQRELYRTYLDDLANEYRQLYTQLAVNFFMILCSLDGQHTLFLIYCRTFLPAL